MIDPETSLTEMFDKLERLNYFLAMGVPSGFSGQEFCYRALDNIVSVRNKFPGVVVGVDGGMNALTIQVVKLVNVDVINTSSYFWLGDQAQVIQMINTD